MSPALEQRKAMQQSIDHLAKQVSDLKAKLAVGDRGEPTARIAKISARADRAPGSDVTGSIPTARADAGAAAAAAAGAAHRRRRQPAHGGARAGASCGARGGLIDVEGRDGIYEVVPGAVLPGLGPVQSIERRDGRWVVVTPKGLIVSARDRGYFD